MQATQIAFGASTGETVFASGVERFCRSALLAGLLAVENR
jgi:acetyl-CoA acetyltransferase